MKKFLAILLALVMCFSFFTGCRKTPDPEPTPTPEVSDNTNDKLDADAAQSAIAYLKNMYKNVDEITAKDFQRIGVVPVGATKVQVVWTVDVSEDLIKIVVEENGMVTIDVNEECTEETPYVLTATVTDAEGKAHTLSWNHILPAKQDALDILKAAYALAPGQELGYEVTLTGVITKVDTPYDANYGNISVIMVVDGYEEYPILCYRLKGTGAENLTKEDTITVTGTIVNYNGTIEFNSGCVLDSYVKGDYVPSQAPDSMTQIVDEAYALGANQELDYIAVLTGKITKIKTPYDTGYGNISVEIEVEGREGKPILCYRMKGPGAETLEINDTITVSGTITNYVGSSGYSTIEYKAGCTLLNVVKGTGAPKAPDSMTQIVDEAYALGANQDLLYEATLTGVITKVKTPYDSGYNNVSVEIVVAGREDKPILCYRMKGTGADIIDVGDTITVKGYITNYVGDKGYNTIEYKAGCQLLSYVINDKTATLEEAATKLQESYPDGFKNGIELVDALTVRTTEFTVAWAVETANEVAAKIVDGKLVLTPADEDVDYKLTATISNAAGETKTVSWDLVVSTKFLEVTQVTGAPEVGVVYKWGLVQKKLDGKPTLYFAGVMNGYYGATTKNAEEAVDVVLETAEGGYYLSFTDPDGAKKYVNVVVSGTHINFTIADTAATVYAFNSEIGTLTTKLDNETYYIGTYGTFNTLSVSKLSYITGDKAGDLDTYSFPARFFTAEWVSGAATLEEGVEQLKADYADGFTNGIELNAITTVRNTGFTTTWKLTSGDTAAKIEDGKLVLTSQATETAYTLVATITDGTDTKAVEFSYKVPALPTAADAVAALQEKYAEDHKFKNGDALDSTIVLKDDTYEVSFDITWAVTAGGTVAKVEEGKLVFNPSDVDVDYTLTATVTKGEDSATASWDGVVSNTYLQVTLLEGAPVAGTAYKWGVAQNTLGKTFYFTGAMDTYYGATSEDAEEAVDVVLETAEGGYYLSFTNPDGAKKYVNIVVTESGDKTYTNFTIADTASTVYTYNAEIGTLTTVLSNVPYYIGTYSNDYNNYTTLSCSKLSYITSTNLDVTQFPARFYTAEWVSGSATVAEGAAQLENTYADGIDNGTELPTTVQVRNTAFSVSDWTVTAGSAAAKIEGGKLVLTSQAAATEYTLTATVTDAEGNTETVTITGTVPALPTAADAIAKLQEKYATDYKFKNGDVLDKTVVISGDTFEDITFDVVWTVTVAEGKPAVAAVKDYTLVYSPSDEDVDYTLTATVAKGEDSATASWNGTVANTYLQVTLLEGAPVAGTAYKWGVAQNTLGKTFYFTGTMDTHFGATSEDAEEAVTVVLETADGGYYISFTDSTGAKKYVNVVASGTYTNFTIEDTAATIYTYNEEVNSLTTMLGTTAYYIGTYTKSDGTCYTTMSVSKLSYITGDKASALDVTSFPARFYTAEWVSGSATLEEAVEQLKADYADGFVNGTVLSETVKVRNTTFTVSGWTVTAGAAAATIDGNKLVLTSQATETPYTLVATLTDAENNTETVTFTGTVPALPTAAEAAASLQAAHSSFANGDTLDATYEFEGVTFNVTWAVNPESAAAKVENNVLGLTAQAVDTAYTLVATVNGTATATWTGTVPAAEVETTVELVEAGTISFADSANRTYSSTTQQIWEQNGITVTYDKGSYKNNLAEYADPVRFYAGTNITIAYSGMRSVVIDCNSDKSTTGLTEALTNGGYTYTQEGYVVTITLNSAVDVIEIQGLTAQIRVNSITVYVEPQIVDHTISFADSANRTYSSTTQQIWEQNGITVTYDKGSYKNNLAEYADPVRFYAGTNITIAYSGMRSVVIDCNSDKSTTGLTEALTNGGYTYTQEGYVVTITLNSAVDVIEIQGLTAQIRVNSITVYTLEIPGSGEPQAPTAADAAADLKAANSSFADGDTLVETYEFEGVTFNVTWAVTTDNAAAATIDNNQLVLTSQDAATAYTLTATVANGADSATAVWTSSVPPISFDPEVGTAYKFGMVQGNKGNVVYYLTGGMSDYYMATTTNAAAAADVFVEETTGGYYFYTVLGGTRQYINMVTSVSGDTTYVNGKYEDTASTVYTYDSESKTLTAVVNEAEYWFGTRNDKTYTTVGPVKVEYNGFYCQFYASTTVEPAVNASSVFSGTYTYGTGDYSNVIVNWGNRGTVATSLSDNAEAFYAANNTSYDDLDDLAGSDDPAAVPESTLYLALQTLMSDAHDYVTSYDETRYLFQLTDCMNGDINTLSCFYSGSAIGPEWDGTTWNREHCWPKSKTSVDGTYAVNADLMTLRPVVSNLNSGRGNTAYGDSDGYYYPTIFSYDLRGDVARIVLYTYVRWGETNLTDVIERVDVLLDWMEADPVDTWELGRNDSVESITGTRNVFVDYPELAFLLFGEGIPANMATPSNAAA